MKEGLLKLITTIIIFGMTFGLSKIKEETKKEQEEKKFLKYKDIEEGKSKIIENSKNEDNVSSFFKEVSKNLDSKDLEKIKSKKFIKNITEKSTKGNEIFSDFLKSFSDKGQKEIIEKSLNKEKNITELKDLKENVISSGNSADELINKINEERESYRNRESFVDSLQFAKKVSEDNFFEEKLTKKELRRAIVLSEILDKPVSLRDE